MSYTTLEIFPDIREAKLHALPVLCFGQPTLGQARKHPRTYLESRMVRPLRSNFAAYPHVFQEPDLYGRPLGAYADVRPSTAYPRLTAFVEAELSPTAFGWLLKVHAKHGNQDNLAGTFQLNTYPEACLHLGGWIWFASQWIGSSWKAAPPQSITPRSTRELLDFHAMAMAHNPGRVPYGQSPASVEEDHLVHEMLRRALERMHGYRK